MRSRLGRLGGCFHSGRLGRRRGRKSRRRLDGRLRRHGDFRHRFSGGGGSDLLNGAEQAIESGTDPESQKSPRRPTA